LRVIKVSPDQARAFTANDPDAQQCCDVLSRNIGIRRASSDWLITLNVDCVLPSRSSFDQSFEEEGFYTCARRDVALSALQHIDPTDIKSVQQWAVEHFATLPARGKGEACPGDVWSLIECCGIFRSRR
jgi:hypothetical protein